MNEIVLKIVLKFVILALELLREVYYHFKKEDEVDEKIKKRISRIITDARAELTKISKPFDPGKDTTYNEKSE